MGGRLAPGWNDVVGEWRSTGRSYLEECRPEEGECLATWTELRLGRRVMSVVVGEFWVVVIDRAGCRECGAAAA